MKTSEKISEFLSLANPVAVYKRRKEFKTWLLHARGTGSFDGNMKLLHSKLDEAKDFKPEAKLVRALSVRNGLLYMGFAYESYFADGDGPGNETIDKYKDSTTAAVVALTGALVFGGLVMGGAYLLGALAFVATPFAAIFSPSDRAVRKFFGVKTPEPVTRPRLRLADFENKYFELENRAKALTDSTINKHADELMKAPNYRRIRFSEAFIHFKDDINEAFNNAGRLPVAAVVAPQAPLKPGFLPFVP